MNTQLDADLVVARKLYIRASIVGSTKEYETARERFAMLKEHKASLAMCHREIGVATMSSGLLSDPLFSSGTVMDKGEGKERKYRTALAWKRARK